ncbi:MAG: AGE family epimerase/isomerase [Nitratireductor sp.]
MNASRYSGGRIIPVIMAGGIGSRLWPLSRQDKPKQFLTIMGKQSLLQQTVGRVLEDGNPLGIERMIVVTNRDFAHETMEQLSGFPEIEFDFIFEPAVRNTGPAMAAAAVHVNRNYPGSVMVMLAADHHIVFKSEFLRLLAVAANAASDDSILTFGIRPDRPETGYGYIKFEDNGTELCTVAEFVEKPDHKTAAKWVASGDYLWNSGMFCFEDKTLLDAYELHCKDVLEGIKLSYENAQTSGSGIFLSADEYENCRSISIDYAIMEHSSNIKVVPASIGWSDVGGWNQIAELAELDPSEQVGRTMLIQSTNNHFHTGEKLVVAIGVDNLVVVDTSDAMLVMHRDRSQEVRQVYESLKAQADDLIATPFRQMSTRQKASYNQQRIRRWLVDDALPLWLNIGWDRRHGGFIENFDRTGHPRESDPRRVRVLARQLYAFSRAKLLGWQVNCTPVLKNAMDFLRQHAQSEDGGWVYTLGADGRAIDQSVHTYDQAFVLFGLSWAYKATGSTDALEMIRQTVDFVDEHLCDKVNGGYFDTPQSRTLSHELETKRLVFEDQPVSQSPIREPGFADASAIFTSRSRPVIKNLNPHMHLLEAFLALYEATGDRSYLDRSAAIVAPLKNTALDGQLGALPEIYDASLAPLSVDAGQWCEPGHHFEWAHLLLSYGRLVGEDMSEQARKLFSFAEAFGISPVTGLVIDRMSPEGKAIEDTSRLWPQLERLRCMLALRKTGMDIFEDKIEMCVQSVFEAYLDPAPDGMWEDKIDARGRIISKEIPQSSFYHIVAAFTDYLEGKAQSGRFLQ